MGEQVSKALIKLLEEMCQVETMEMKIKGVIFTRKCTGIIKEKVSYLENLLQKEANTYKQKIDKFNITKNYIISSYREKLENLYKEYYLQYVNIQDELQDAKFKQRALIIKYQELINKKESELKNPIYINYINTKKELLEKLSLANNSEEYNVIYKKITDLKSPVLNIEDKKEELKSKHDKYQKVINLCNQKFITCGVDFENQVNNEFIIATSLIVSKNNSFIDKIKNLFSNWFLGNQKFNEILESYKDSIEKIDCEKLIKQIREETIDFVEQSLGIKMEFVDEMAV